MKKNLFLLGVIGLLMPFGADALSGNVSLNCAKSTLKSGDSMICTIKANTDEEASGISGKIVLGDNLTLEQFNVAAGWEGTGNEGNIGLYTDKNKKGEFDIGSFVVKAGNKQGVDTSVSLSDVSIADADFNEETFTVQPFSVRVVSKDNGLSDIKINGKTIEGFDSSKDNFELSLSDTKVTISATATNSSSKITGDIGEKKLEYGNNTFKINVTSETGDVKKYTLYIDKPEIRQIKSITMNGDKFHVVNGVYSFTKEYKKNVSSIVFDAELVNEADVDFVEGFGPRTVDNLVPGKNVVLFKTVDKNGEVLTYTINVNILADGDNTSGDNNSSTDNDKKEDNTTDKNDTNKKEDNVKNPDTGVNVSIVLAVSMLLIGGITYIVLKNKNYFKKI